MKLSILRRAPSTVSPDLKPERYAVSVDGYGGWKVYRIGNEVSVSATCESREMAWLICNLLNSHESGR